MTTRQAFLKFVYPLWMLLAKFKKKSPAILINQEAIKPVSSFYNLETLLNNGDAFSFTILKGKKVLLVNTASDCGFTKQYKDLQEIYAQYNNKLIVIGFPSNDFKEQEKGTDEAIAQFCKENFGIRFPLMKKSFVRKGLQQNSIYQWLSNAEKNGWNDQAPSWNFSKYLVNEEGILTHYFPPAISPLGIELLNALDL